MRPLPTITTPRALNGHVQTAFDLPGRILGVSLAPTENGLHVATTARWTLSDAPISAYIRQRGTRGWEATEHLDAPAPLGVNTGAALIAALPNGGVIAAWGGSAADDGGLWVRETTGDAQWAAPQRIAGQVRRPLSLAAHRSGYAVLIAEGYTRVGSDAPGHTTLLVRTPDGRWNAPETLTIPAVFGSVVLLDTPAGPRAAALLTTKSVSDAVLVWRALGTADTWRTTLVRADVPATSAEQAPFLWHPQGVAFTRPDGVSGAAFALTRRGQSAVLVLRSTDGQRWDTLQTARPHQNGQLITHAAPLYDAANDQIIVLYACCGNAANGQSATHAVIASAINSRTWRTSPHPLLLGERSATLTTAHGDGTHVWVGWVEQGSQMLVRRQAIAALAAGVVP